MFQEANVYGRIYKITNKINGKVYIGQTKMSIKRRFYNHCQKGAILFSAINKYGKDNFNIQEICVAFNKKDLDLLETKIINKYKSITPNGYNIEGGGNGKKVVHASTRKKIRKANLGKKHTKETRKKMSNSHKGKVRSKAHRLNLSKSLKGKAPCRKTIEAAQKANRGRIPPNSRKVVCLENNKTYNSLHHAARELNCLVSKISLVCQGKRKTTNNLRFRYI